MREYKAYAVLEGKYLVGLVYGFRRPKTIPQYEVIEITIATYIDLLGGH